MGGILLLITLASCQETPSTVDAPAVADTITTPSPSYVPLGESSGNLPPPPPENSYLAQLSPDATNQLISLAIDIAIPTYLPPAMTLANYGTGETAAGSSYYWLVYRDDQNRCFAIEYSSRGGEDMSLENQEPLEHFLFGDGYHLYHGKFPNGEVGELPTSDLFTDWLEGTHGFYRLVGAGLVNAQDYGQHDCVNITVKEAISIAESLSYLPTDIRTLDIIPATPTP